MEHERCYIYTPPETNGRAPKRRRISKGDPKIHLPERLQTFRHIWAEQEERIRNTLEEADRATQDKIVDFVSSASPSERQVIPTGLIVAGPSIASHGSFFDRLGKRIKKDTNSAYTVLTSADAPNLKTLLKNLIKKTTSRVEDDDDDDDMGCPTSSARNGSKLLGFDLGHIQGWRVRNPVDGVVIAFQDSEAFDARVLVEMIDLFYSWLDRIPFVLLFGIATSAESFEDRLSRKTLRYLEGQKFDVTQSDEIIERLFRVTVASANVPLRIGPTVARRILDRQKDHVQNTQDFSDGLKYAYMSHFYASYPTIFLKSDLSKGDLTTEAFEAVRNMPSFRRWIEAKVDAGESRIVRKLLDSDDTLFDYIVSHLKSGQTALNGLSCAVRVLDSLRRSLQMSPTARLSSIWVRAASADMIGSPFLRETMLSLKKMSPERFLQLLETWSSDDLDSSFFTLDLGLYVSELEALIEANDGSIHFRNQHDVGNESLRTTVVAQKVLLSKHKATLSEHDKAYSELVGRLHEELGAYFANAFIDPKDLFLSEILMYDLKSPHTEVFQPRPRFAIERALSSPHDYLGCDCCGTDRGEGEGASLSATLPATAILYQLYLESGSLINVSDLWSAFHAMVGDDEEDSEPRAMALFQRALAELKHLGFVKPSRKKTDHIAKTMWKGL
ncbi:uncharacterized protein EI97DRAFT_410033 [Westerdykella ornata]|uniref:Uncharacterized protein n=1 Tax=Westerdykella ornata TaxID=318751 RepID=A0A6A6JZM8_WESOR|nr:uncharacterized protein EI97DRAFT_410033 [Westerdykella ornata]KAF2281318.1 hypothetical protein EI97DRAFT_410033 [Westerdykella ornata]